MPCGMADATNDACIMPDGCRMTTHDLVEAPGLSCQPEKAHIPWPRRVYVSQYMARRWERQWGWWQRVRERAAAKQ